MRNIIAASFQAKEDADHARATLCSVGFPVDQVSVFYVSPTGQLETGPADSDSPAGLQSMLANGAGVAAAARSGGMLVATLVPNPQERYRVVELFRALGGSALEQARGKIQNGRWIDFDPQQAPEKLMGW